MDNEALEEWAAALLEAVRALEPDPSQVILVGLVWPLVSVLIPVLVAIGVAKHGRTTTMRALDKQLAVQERHSKELDATAAIERRRKLLASLLVEVADRLVPSPHVAEWVASHQRLLVTVRLVEFDLDPDSEPLLDDWLRRLSQRDGKIWAARKAKKPWAEAASTVWMGTATTVLLALGRETKLEKREEMVGAALEIEQSKFADIDDSLRL